MTLLTRPDGSDPADFHLSRRAAAGVFFVGYAAAALSARAEPIHTDDAGLAIETVTLPAANFALPAYVARPKAPGRFPVVIVVNEVFGIHDYIKDSCRRLAKLGYVAIAPAFFVRVADPAPLTDMAAVIKIVSAASDPQVMGDVGAAIRFLQAAPYVDGGKIAITGFCWGGGVTWLACEQFRELRCGVAWYGRMVPPAGAAANPNRLWPVERVDHLTAPVLRPLQAQGRPGNSRFPPCVKHWRRRTRPTARSSSIPTPATVSTPTIEKATSQPTPRTAGSGCWPTSVATGSRPEATRRPRTRSASTAELAHQDLQVLSELGILRSQRLDPAHRVKHGRVIAPAEPAANVGQGSSGELLGQPHRRLTRASDRAGPALGEQVGLL